MPADEEPSGSVKTVNESIAGGGGAAVNNGEHQNTTHVRSDRRHSFRSKKMPFEVGVFDIWALGIVVVIGGQYFCWNAGLVAGFGSYTIATILVGTAYICLCLSMGEVTSVLPFAGGAYGFTRLAFGLYPGFIIGTCELVEYMVYVASSAYTLCQMIAGMTGSPPELMPVYCLAFYVSALACHITGGFFFWRSTAAMAVVSFLVVLMYGFGSIKFADLQQYGPSPLTNGTDDEYSWFLGGMPMFMQVMPLSAWFYVGVETLNLANGYPLEPRITIPWGSVLCILTLFATSMLVLLVCSGLPPLPSEYILGDDDAASTSLAADLNPLNKGFIMMFSTPGGPVLSQSMATLLSIPATYATAFGFIFAYGRVLYSMARSKLYPDWLALSWGPEEIPYAAHITGSVFGYALCLLVYFVPYVGTLLFNQCILAAFMAYICQCGAYVWFKIYHGDMPRMFTSPLGIFGAVYGGLVFSMAFIASLFFQPDNFLGLYIFVSTMAIYTLYYYGYARSRQQFSPEEKFIFVAQIVKFNERSRRRAAKGRRTLNKKMVDLPIFSHVTALLGKAMDSSGRFSMSLSKSNGSFSFSKTSAGNGERRSHSSVSDHRSASASASLGVSAAMEGSCFDDEEPQPLNDDDDEEGAGDDAITSTKTPFSVARLRAFNFPWSKASETTTTAGAPSVSQRALLPERYKVSSSGSGVFSGGSLRTTISAAKLSVTLTSLRVVPVTSTAPDAAAGAAPDAAAAIAAQSVDSGTGTGAARLSILVANDRHSSSVAAEPDRDILEEVPSPMILPKPATSLATAIAASAQRRSFLGTPSGASVESDEKGKDSKGSGDKDYDDEGQSELQQSDA